MSNPKLNEMNVDLTYYVHLNNSCLKLNVFFVILLGMKGI